MSDDLIKEKFENHEDRISQLEKNTKILETMNYRIGEMENNIKSINNKLDVKEEYGNMKVSNKKLRIMLCIYSVMCQ